jgi:hypothetical protein
MCLVSSCLTRSRAILIAPVLSEERGGGAVAGTPKMSSKCRRDREHEQSHECGDAFAQPHHFEHEHRDMRIGQE